MRGKGEEGTKEDLEPQKVRQTAETQWDSRALSLLGLCLWMYWICCEILTHFTFSSLGGSKGRTELLLTLNRIGNTRTQPADPWDPPSLLELRVGRGDLWRQGTKTNQTQQRNWEVRKEGGEGKEKPEKEHWGAEQRTNLMDKEDTGTSIDANSNHSPDSSIHTCKEESVRERLS